MPRIAVLSESYMNDGRSVDATRHSFINAIADFGFDVGYFQCNDFDFKNLHDAYKFSKGLEQLAPDLVISLNAAGLTAETMGYLEKKSVPAVTWYWDSPDLLNPQSVTNSKLTDIFSACIDFESSRTLNQKMQWLPFSSVGAKAESLYTEIDRPRDIVHLGTLWACNYIELAKAGLYRSSNKEFYFGRQLYEAIFSEPSLEELWLTEKGQIVRSKDLKNAFSGIKRARILSALTDFDLQVCGGYDWLFYLWGVAPELLKNYSYANVCTHEQMSHLLRQFKINLNIFHSQNKNGGPNFRIFDSAVHGAAILSEKNQKCAEVFPHNVAALYYSNMAEAYEYSRALINDNSLRKRLVLSAAEILNEHHTHEKRISFFAERFGLTKSKTRGAITVVSHKIKPASFEEKAGFEDNAKPPDPLQTRFFLSAQHEVNLSKNMERLERELMNISYTRLSGLFIKRVIHSFLGLLPVSSLKQYLPMGVLAFIRKQLYGIR